MSSSVRSLAAQALAPLLRPREPASLQDTLGPLLSVCPVRDRGLLTELVQGTARQGLYLQALIAPLIRKPIADEMVLALLLLGLYQIEFTRIPEHAAVQETVACTKTLGCAYASGFINALLRRFLRERDALVAKARSRRHSHPEWLVQSLRQDWPEQWLDILEANNTIPSLTLRIHQGRIDRSTYLQHLQSAGIEASLLTPPDAIGLQRSQAIDTLPGFHEGWFSIQDAHAQEATLALPLTAQMSILDACAAPGGKTTYLLERAQLLPASTIKILALDIAAHRLTRLKENLERLRLHATLQQGDARHPEHWWDQNLFDAIVLDVPCSGTGILRRHPDIRWLRQASDIPALAQTQRELLDAVWPLLKPEGHLLYLTCSLLRTENDLQISRFLQQHPDAQSLLNTGARPGIQRFPGDHDGFYHALLQKQV